MVFVQEGRPFKRPEWAAKTHQPATVNRQRFC
jgi:hypothetical protein